MKKIVMLTASLVLSGCSTVEDSITGFVGLPSLSTYESRTTEVTLDDLIPEPELICFGTARPDNREIHIGFAEVKSGILFFTETAIRDGAFRHFSVSDDLVDNLTCDKLSDMDLITGLRIKAKEQKEEMRIEAEEARREWNRKYGNKS